jgi:MFS transporter, DHA1 family, tetracycline resistance protein
MVSTMNARSESRPRRAGLFVLIPLVLATYLANVSATAMTPFLLEIAHDLNADLGAIGILLSASSITWGAVSVFAGLASDRLGRRPVMLVGLIGLALGPLGLAAAEAV